MDVTRVIALLPKLDGKGYTEQVWEVGKKRLNPSGKIDVVEGIEYYTEPKIFVSITYRDFGEEWILDHISFIEHARDRSIQHNESADSADEGGEG